MDWNGQGQGETVASSLASIIQEVYIKCKTKSPASWTNPRASMSAWAARAELDKTRREALRDRLTTALELGRWPEQ